MAMAARSTPGFLAIGPSDAVTRRLKTSETVARDVVRYIIDKGLQQGDSLPAEAAMLAQYGVSRESLREGLRLLEVQGLISIRRGPGGGPVVGIVDPANLGRISTLYYEMAGATYQELFEAWTFAECELALRAARHPDRSERAAVMSPYLVGPHVDLADDSGAGTPGALTFLTTHATFHGAVASLARNRVLQLSLQAMGQIVTHQIAVNQDPRALRATIEDDHRKLARAVIGGHPQQARSLMEQHIQAIMAYHLEVNASRMTDFIEWQ
jgi:GntR family transcriptional regulator, transcriptional repressor for pyruvate dehydrogenase complex